MPACSHGPRGARCHGHLSPSFRKKHSHGSNACTGSLCGCSVIKDEEQQGIGLRGMPRDDHWCFPCPGPREKYKMKPIQRGMSLLEPRPCTGSASSWPTRDEFTRRASTGTPACITSGVDLAPAPAAHGKYIKIKNVSHDQYRADDLHRAVGGTERASSPRLFLHPSLNAT